MSVCRGDHISSLPHIVFHLLLTLSLASQCLCAKKRVEMYSLRSPCLHLCLVVQEVSYYLVFSLQHKNDAKLCLCNTVYTCMTDAPEDNLKDGRYANRTTLQLPPTIPCYHSLSSQSFGIPQLLNTSADILVVSLCFAHKCIVL